MFLQRVRSLTVQPPESDPDDKACSACLALRLHADTSGMSRVLITGAAGFLGQRLCRMLVAKGELTGADGVSRRVTEIQLSDIVDTAPPVSESITITNRRGDLSDRAFARELAEYGFDSIFHLASLLTLQAEQDPEHAYAVNVGALRQLASTAPQCPKVVFASSIAVFGGDLPDVVDDHVAPAPATTYGTHKAINELLIADYSRLGRIDGRSLRLPIVLLRAGAAQPAVSDRVAALVREPLNGQDTVSPLRPETRIPVASVGAVCRALVQVHDLPADKLPPKRVMNLPALTVSITDMLASVRRNAGKGEIAFVEDPVMQAIVDSWPKQFISDRATQAGIGADPDFDAIIADYLENRTG